MKISFSTNAFVRYSVFEAVEKIAAIGYEGVELLADYPHLYAPVITRSDLDRLKELLDRTGLRVANVNANTAMGYYGRQFWEPLFEPSLANPDPVARRWRIDYTKKCIDMAHTLGSRNVSITSGRMVSGIDPEESTGLLMESLRELLAYTEQSGIRLGIEYEPGLLIECYEELRAVMEGLNSPCLGANLDLGHSHVLGENPEETISGLSPKIFHIHIEDIRSRKHYHLIPGLGDMDFGLLFKILDKFCYRDFMSVELYTYPHRPEEAARHSLEHLRKI